MSYMKQHKNKLLICLPGKWQTPSSQLYGAVVSALLPFWTFLGLGSSLITVKSSRGLGGTLSVGLAVSSPPSPLWAWALETQWLVYFLSVLWGSFLGSMGSTHRAPRVRSEGLCLVPLLHLQLPFSALAPQLLTLPTVAGKVSLYPAGTFFFILPHSPLALERKAAERLSTTSYACISVPSMWSGQIYGQSPIPTPCSILLFIPCFPNTLLLLVLLYFSLFCSISNFQVCTVD